MMVHIGLDMHKQFSAVAVLDDAGAVLERCTLHHDDPTKLAEYFGRLGGDGTVTMEATRGWYWLADLIESEGLTVKLAHPAKVRLIADARIKTDKIDAWVLAHLERLGFLPESYIPPQEVRDRRELLRYRLGLVSLTTGLKNRVHALLAKLGIMSRQTDLFGKSGREFLAGLKLRDVYRRVLDGWLATIDFLACEVKRVTSELRAELKEDFRAELLKSTPGVGVLTAYLLLAEIGDIGRFSSAKRLCSYAGLVPRTYQSGGKNWQGGITRQGNRYIRYAMVEAAQVATRKDAALDLFYQRLKREKGAGKARVAVARKLLVAVYHILKRSEPYRYGHLARIHLGKPAFVPGHAE